jgi:hypothetical protein
MRGSTPGEGTDLRLYELISRPEITRFHFARPGIARLKRLQARLLKEQGIVETQEQEQE